VDDTHDPLGEPSGFAAPDYLYCFVGHVDAFSWHGFSFFAPTEAGAVV
jgi:hypothetical protein